MISTISKRILFWNAFFIMACNSQPVHQPVTATTNTISLRDTAGWPASFRLGRLATPAEIEKMDLDVRPDGAGLPAGQGNAVTGRVVYLSKCAACHGLETTPGDTKLSGPVLVNSTPDKKDKTIGNYWPYATTLFDYVRRTMPYNQPGSLTNEEVYQLTAYLLAANKVIDQQEVLNAQTLPKVVMPAKARFIDDDRRGGPEVR